MILGSTLDNKLGKALEYMTGGGASNWDLINLFFLRPVVAILFVFSLLVLGWFLAWKLVLVHVPLVQEIFGLRKKSFTPKPLSRRRFSKFYNSRGTSE